MHFRMSGSFAMLFTVTFPDSFPSSLSFNACSSFASGNVGFSSTDSFFSGLSVDGSELLVSAFSSELVSSFSFCSSSFSSESLSSSCSILPFSSELIGSSSSVVLSESTSEISFSAEFSSEAVLSPSS